MTKVQIARLRWLLATSALIVCASVAVDAHAAGQTSTCSEIVQRCLQHAELIAQLKAQNKWSTVPVAPQNQITKEQCQREMQQAKSSGYWPGHYGSKPVKCQ